MSIWEDAAATIAAAFADPEPLLITQPGHAQIGIVAIRSDVPDPDPMSTQRRVSYEIAFGALPQRPSKQDVIVHRGRIWRVEQIEDDTEVGAWRVYVGNNGPAT